MTNDEIIAAGQQIYDETEVAANTSERVGGVIKGIGQNLKEKDADIAAEAARNGYYQCTVSGTTLAVTAPGFTLPAHGGNIRIKMSAPATGACTLNINSTGPKALLYNGAAVSSANTWEKDEIISVFYDPSGSGQYLASNSQGGGGKAEKIKYDNSQSGLSAENVQGALDEVSNNSLYWEKKSLYNADYSVFIISNSLTNPIWTSTNGATSILLKVNAGDRLKIVGNGNETGTDYAFLKNNTIVYQQTPAFAEGYTHRERGSATIPFELDVPSDAEYLWIMYQSGGSIKMPEVYVRNNVEDLAEEVEKCPCESMDGQDTDLDLADEAGFVIARFRNGFDSGVCPSQESEENVELDIADKKGNVIVRFANGHVYTKYFDSSQSGGGGSSKSKKSIKILFLGNSVTQDHATYLPWLLKNTYGVENIEFAVSIFYCGGSSGTIKEYATTIADGGRNAEIFSSVVNTDVWTNETDISLDTALARQAWDIISIQGWVNGSNEDVIYIPTLIEKLVAKMNHPFELAYLINQTPSAKPTVLVNTAKQVCRDYSISMLFPPALVTEYARQAWGTEFISPDGGHNREGLPCIMTAYSIMLTLCRRLGLWDAIIGNELRITAAEIERMKIPGQNGSLVATTDAQYLQAQEFAVKSVNAADAILNEAKTNCLNNLMN